MDVDLAIIGSGFGGSLLAMVAHRLGRRVILVERGQHPRFAIGESASPLAGVVLEQLADRYDLPRVKPLGSYGSWKRTYPDVTCGLKRGFTSFKHEAGKPFRSRPDRSTELLVAASPCDEVSDTHWLRADVDHFLVREATALGVDYLDRVDLDGIEWQPSGAPILNGNRLGKSVRIRAGRVVDATGPRGFLSRALALDAPGFAAYPSTQALFSHFTGVGRCDQMPDYGLPRHGREAAEQGATVRRCDGARVRERRPGPVDPAEGPEVRGCEGPEVPPYPIDDAALHHVFDDGWMWVLRFGNGVTSAGVAVSDALAADLRLADGEPAWKRLLARYPSIAAQFAEARPIREFTWMPRVAFRTSVAAGDRWAMLPSAAAFVDPFFSSGIPLTLVGIERLARLMEEGEFACVAGSNRNTFAGSERTRPTFAEYSRATLAEADHTARFIAGCYASFPRFRDFTAYAMFYFAAASFSEMTRRLGGVSRGFLCEADAEFAAAVAQLSPAIHGHDDLASLVSAAVARLNIAGLCDPAKRNWYGVDLEDTIRDAAKLGATAGEVRAMLSQFS